jgi:hypothetical protein
MPAGAEAPGRFARPLGRSRWGIALVLAIVVLLFGVADGFALVALPLGILLIGLSARVVWWVLGMAAVAWALTLALAGTAIQTTSSGWALLLGGSFLGVSLLQPRWHVLSRALTAVAAAFLAAAAWLTLSGRWAQLDQTMAEHFRSVASFTTRELRVRFPDTAWAGGFATMADRVADLQTSLFPALLGLQSLAALGLVWWAFSRSRSRSRMRPALRPLREFRFHDSLIWVVIGGLLLAGLPLGEGLARVGYNLLFFMAALYVLRGIAVFVFLARGAPTITPVVLGVIAAVFFHQIVFTAALLVGLGDTWLDVRGRVLAAASRA